MRLSDQEKAILVVAQFLPEQSIRELQKATGFREHVLRYTLEKAISSGLLQKRCFVNLNLLGYSQFQVFFTPIAETKGARQALLDELIRHERVSWAGELGGDFHFGLNICVRDIVEVSKFLELISKKAKIRFLDKLIAARLKLTHFGHRFLSPRTEAGKPLEYEATSRRVRIDETDHRILQEIVQPNFPAHREIARRLGLPFSTVEYRINKLERQGVIQGYYYLLNSAALGYQNFMVQLRIKDINPAKKKAMYNFCKQHPAAMVYIESIGAWDLEVYFHVPEARAMVTISQQMQDEFASQLLSLKVIPMLSFHKLQEYPFRSWES